MGQRILIPATTLAVTSPVFSGVNNNNIGIQCTGLYTGESIVVQVAFLQNENPFTVIWAPLLINGQQIKLDLDNNVLTIFDDTQTYRLIKSATLNAVAVSITADIKIGSL